MARKMRELRLGKQDLAKPACTCGPQVMQVLAYEALIRREGGDCPQPVGSEQGGDIDKHVCRNPLAC